MAELFFIHFLLLLLRVIVPTCDPFLNFGRFYFSKRSNIGQTDSRPNAITINLHRFTFSKMVDLSGHSPAFILANILYAHMPKIFEFVLDVVVERIAFLQGTITGQQVYTEIVVSLRNLKLKDVSFDVS